MSELSNIPWPFPVGKSVKQDVKTDEQEEPRCIPEPDEQCGVGNG